MTESATGICGLGIRIIYWEITEKKSFDRGLEKINLLTHTYPIFCTNLKVSFDLELLTCAL